MNDKFWRVKGSSRDDFDFLFGLQEVVNDLVKDDFLLTKKEGLSTLELRQILQRYKEERRRAGYPAIWCFRAFVWFHISQFYRPFIVEFLRTERNHQ